MKTPKEIKTAIFYQHIHELISECDQIILDIPQPSVSEDAYMQLARVHDRLRQLKLLFGKSHENL